MGNNQPSIIALLHGPDRAGLVADVARWIFDNGGNILHADQHRDDVKNIFFQRLEWTPGQGSLAEQAAAFKDYVQGLGMDVDIGLSSEQLQVAVMVSKITHCFHDILLRWKAGELACNIACVISNHATLKEEVAHYGLPFHTIPVSKANKTEAEAQQIALLKDYGVQLVLMARYMQILSKPFLDTVGCPVINIHHSFLPAFAGAKPYHQAHARGVKLIGATAHYATEILDEGPIICQSVASVSHRDSVSHLIRKGRDLEKIVFAQATRCHLERRILVYGNKTVIFD